MAKDNMDLLPIILVWAGVVALAVIAGLFFSRNVDKPVDPNIIKPKAEQIDLDTWWCEPKQGQFCAIKGTVYIVL